MTRITMRQSDPVNLVFSAPPSKSLTHRALIAAALAEGRSRIYRPLTARDTLVTRRALEALGVTIDEGGDWWDVTGCGGVFPQGPDLTIDMEDSGTSLRLLMGTALLTGTQITLTGSTRLQERPIGPLGDALRALGGHVRYLRTPGSPPVEVRGPLRGGLVSIDGSLSSQFASSVLLAAPYAKRPVILTLTGTVVSKSYIDLTIGIMGTFGINVWTEGETRMTVPAGRGYTAQEYRVEGDYSSASYFFAIAAVCGGTVTVRGLFADSFQGDVRFLTALAAMGCTISTGSNSISLSRDPDTPLTGITIDMATSPDTVPTLAAVAACGQSPTTIRGIGHLRHKESDRIRETARIIRALGGDVREGEDSMQIIPRPLHGGTIDPAGDHRNAMSAAVLGCAIGGVIITDAETVNKSFPGFWDALSEAQLI